MSERSTYSERYRTPSPRFPQKTVTTLARLLASWERLRELDVHGYRTSKATPPSTWLVDIDWGDRSTHRSPGRGTTCSPFVAQASAMAFSAGLVDAEPYAPRLSDGTHLPFLFSQLANGVLKAGVPAYERALAAVGATLADNEWPRPVIFFNMGHAVELTELRRGDCVHIDWLSGGGHAVFCWDVHLNERGEVDAFQYLSANGRMAGGGSGGGIAVGGTTDGSGGFIRRTDAGAHEAAAGQPSYAAADPPLFRDSPRYVEEGRWVTWDPEVASRPLTGLRSKPKKRPLLVKRVKAARFHGVDVTAIPLYAMGQDEPGPLLLPAPGAVPTSEPSSSMTATAPSEEITALQQQLQLLARIGWIDPGPGKIDGKMGKRTHASLVAFQRAYGLPEDGEPSALVTERLRSVCESARDAPAARAPAPAAGGPVSFGGDGSAESGASITHLYFRHGAGRPGEHVAIIARGCPLPSGPASFMLVEESGRVVATVEAELSGERAAVEFVIPRQPPGARLSARLSCAGGAGLVTAAPLLVARAAQPLSLSEPPQVTPRLLRLEEAIAEVLLGDRSLRAIAAAAGIERDELLRCALRYSEAGRLALARPDETSDEEPATQDRPPSST